MARHAIAADRAGEHTQGREERRRAVAFVVMCYRATAASLQRRPGWVRSRAWI